LQNPSATETEPEKPAPSENEEAPAPVEEPAPIEEIETSSEEAEALPSSTAKAALPSEWPSSIVPQTEIAEGDESQEEDGPVGLAGAKAARRPADTSIVSILLTKALSWQWLLSQSDASAQVFAYMPVLITHALDLDKSSVVTVSLEAWEPPNWSGEGPDV
jgi:hypothetical protein